MKITAKVFKREDAGAPRIKAYANITLDAMFVISNIKVVDGKNGLFISMPNKSMPNGEYKDIAFPITKEAREQMVNAILDEYNKEESAEEPTDLPF